MAALTIVGTAPFVARHSRCTAGEPANEVPSPAESRTVDPLENLLVGSKPDWPRIWELRPGVTLRLRGRIDTDAIWSSQSPANIATFGNLGDVVGFRRAWIGAEGELGDRGALHYGN